MSELEVQTAVYTGAFDPITLGHLNVIERSSRLVGRLVVGVGVNTGKRQLFSPDERAELIVLATAHLPNVEVLPFSGLAVEFVRSCGVRVMVRGVRPLTDIAFEFTMLMGNRELDPGHGNHLSDGGRAVHARLEHADQGDHAALF